MYLIIACVIVPLAFTLVDAYSLSMATKLSVMRQVTRNRLTDESVDSSTEILADVAVEHQITKPGKNRKQPFYKKTELPTTPLPGTPDTTISYPCSSERYREGLEGKR